MADPKTPFWKRFTVTKTKNPISSTKPPARLGVVVAPTVTNSLATKATKGFVTALAIAL